MATSRTAHPSRTTMTDMRFAAFVLAAVLLTGCGGSSRPGDPAVYDRIAAATDCAALQAELDTASRNHDRDIQSGSDLAEADTAYMKAAQDRMTELGC